MVPCRLSRKQGWLLPCIIFQMIGLGFFIASLATTSWIHFACSGHEFEMGIYRICSREMNGSNSEPWNCSAVLLGNNRFTLPRMYQLIYMALYNYFKDDLSFDPMTINFKVSYWVEVYVCLQLIKCSQSLIFPDVTLLMVFNL